MRDDHLAAEHPFQLVPRTNPMKKRQDEVCGRGVEGLVGIRMEGVYDLLKERISDDLLRGPERGQKASAKIIEVLPLIERRLDNLPSFRSHDVDARRWQ